MSPSSKEVIANRALSGTELRSIVHAKLDALMDNEGLLSHYVAYGRVAFTVRLSLHLDNMMQRESIIEGSSTTPAVNDPDPTALETPPLDDPSADASLSASEIEYRIDSPNAERLRHDLPVTMEVRQQDGTVSQQQVTYPKDDTLGDGDVTIRDVTPAARAAWHR